MIELKDIINSSYFINNNEQLKNIIEEERQTQKPKKETPPKPKPKPETKPRNDDVIFFVSTIIALFCIITQTILTIYLL